MLFPAILLSAVTLLAQADTGSGAGTVGDADARYRTCIETVGTDPEAALASAERWADDGGGPLAAHCRGNALMALGRPREAAKVLDALAAEMREVAPAVAARVALQGGQAWSAAGEHDKALAMLDTAAGLAPDDTRVRVQRGILRARSGDLFAAVDDFNAVLDREPENADVLVLRASAYRRLESTELAMDDLTRALRIEPDHPDALLERGLVHMIDGAPGKARADWQRVVENAPESPPAQLARENLKRLERTEN